MFRQSDSALLAEDDKVATNLLGESHGTSLRIPVRQ
jgi:hypothetical protein